MIGVSALAGRAVRAAGPRQFKGKGRLIGYWINHLDPTFVGMRVLPGGGRILCHFDVPYEAMVWARQEEETELGALRTLLSPGDHFVDCGANIGLWSLVAAGCVGDGGRVTAFEPSPLAYERLTRNLSLSAAVGGRISARNLAVAAQSGQMSFDVGGRHNLGRVVFEPGAGRIQVPATSLDDQMSNTPIRAIKIDIEGAEAEALLGAPEILSRQRPWVFAEFNVMFGGTDRIGDWEVFSLLQRYGYRCHRVATASGAVPGLPIDRHERFNGYLNVLFQPPNA